MNEQCSGAGPFRTPKSKEKQPARVGLGLLVFLILASVMLALPAASPAGISISVNIAPPVLPVYTQPLCPGPGYIWVPGYWAWDPVFGYYWVPGLWQPAPFVGALWTPGYWGWSDGVYFWHEGYWGPVVGFYGGVNYGFGYTGAGYYGGYWTGNTYYYNQTVNNVNVTNVVNVYSRPVTVVNPVRTSFNGGVGGIVARPTTEQLSAERQRRSFLTPEQEHHMQAARNDPGQRLSANHGRPAVAATIKPGVFTGHGVVPAGRGGASSRVEHGGQAGAREHVRTPNSGFNENPRTTRPGRTAPEMQRREAGPRAGGYESPRTAGPGRTAPEMQRREAGPRAGGYESPRTAGPGRMNAEPQRRQPAPAYNQPRPAAQNPYAAPAHRGRGYAGEEQEQERERGR